MIKKNTKGSAVISAIIVLAFLSVSVVSNVSRLAVGESERIASWKDAHKTVTGAESALEDVVYRMKKGITVLPSESVVFGSSTVPITLIEGSGSARIVRATSTVGDAVRTMGATVMDVAGGSFNYAVQSGPGGFSMVNSSSVRGGILSEGPITGANSSVIKGDVYSTGATGLIDGIHATGTARAHTIKNSTIDKDAYYQVIQSTTVGGNSYPGSPDPTTSAMPITEADIDAIKERASVNVITSPCPYNISNSAKVSLGPAKIMCNLSVTNSSELTLNGDLWVVGNVSFSNSSKIKMSSSFGDGSVAIVADNPSNRTTSGVITLGNSTVAYNSGTDGSYVVLISGNTSAESGGSNVAVSVSNSAYGELIAYALHGLVTLANSNEIRAAAAYKLRLTNSANISYRNPLKNLYFTSGTGRGWDIQSWRETE